MLKKCLDCVKNIKLDKVAVFAGGVLFGTAGLKAVSYTHLTLPTKLEV